jgi:hypothetical protein
VYATNSAVRKYLENDSIFLRGRHIVLLSPWSGVLLTHFFVVDGGSHMRGRAPVPKRIDLGLRLQSVQLVLYKGIKRNQGGSKG